MELMVSPSSSFPQKWRKKAIDIFSAEGAGGRGERGETYSCIPVHEGEGSFKKIFAAALLQLLHEIQLPSLGDSLQFSVFDSTAAARGGLERD